MKVIPYTLQFLIAVALFILIAHRPFQTKFDKITVQEFEMVDAQGVRRASIKVEEGGTVVFRMMDQQGTSRVKMSGDSEGSGVVLLDNATEPAVHKLAKKDKAGITITVDGKGRRL